MSHMKFPFSWEEKPGIPKFQNSDIEFHNLKIMSEKNEGSSVVVAAPPPLPPPKCSKKGLRRRQDDPFLAALKSCTKAKGDENDVFKEKINNALSKRSFFFSCKNSCNVEDDNLVKFSKLPPIPKERYYARSFVRNFN